MRYLVFQLYGPLASWGVPATGEIRRSATHPSRSALLGLLAAALGIRRDQEEDLAALRDGVAFAIKQLTPGMMMQDYHTAQVPGYDRKAWRLTRKDELSEPKGKLNTILSTREYRCNGYWKVAVCHNGGPWSLEALANALNRPHYPLYLGRKACPPAAPLWPQLVSAGGIREALATPFPALTDLGEERESRLLGWREEVAYAWEEGSGDLDMQETRCPETRYPQDQPLHRGRWQFTTRPEYWHQTREGT